jgi:hypothetical protein
MVKKIILTLVVITVLGLAAYVAYFFTMKAAVTLSDSSVPVSMTNKPAIIGTFISATPTNVIVQLQDGSQKTLNVSSSTQVISQVASGQTGKSLADLTSGTMVLVIPQDSDETSATSISVVPMPPPPSASASGTPVSVDGTLVGKTPSSLTLEVQGGDTITVLINKNTTVLSNVLPGQVGKSISDIVAGMALQISGATGTNGVNANSIVVLGQ